jgi:hypothetical protein
MAPTPSIDPRTGTSARFRPVVWLRTAYRNSPWLVISVTAHVILIAILSLAVVSQKRRPPEEPSVRAGLIQKINAPKIVELPDEPPIRTPLAPADSTPTSESLPSEMPLVPDVPPGNFDQDLPSKSDRVGDPNALFPAPNPGFGGSTAIGTGNQGHRGQAVSDFSSRVPGGIGGRKAGPRAQALRRFDADPETIQATKGGLEWLKNHQTPDEGYWDCDGFQNRCQKNICDGTGYALNDPGVTGLALLAFLGAGHTQREGPYKKTVMDGLRYLKDIQDPEGCFGPRTDQHFVYGHAIATLAVAEAYALTNAPTLQPLVEKGLAFIYHCQNPSPTGTGFLGWRYGVRSGQNDASVTGWMIMALKSASEGGFPVNRPSVEGARAFLDSVTDPATGKVGYTQLGLSPVRQAGREARWPIERSEAITAVGVFSRVFANQMLGIDSSKDAILMKGAQLMTAKLPTWNEADGSVDMYYWYYGTLAMFQMGGEHWKKWNRAMKDVIFKHQRTSGDEKGSWDPVDPWGQDGGRVYSTAVMTMCLEVYSRYSRVLGTRAEPSPK